MKKIEKSFFIRTFHINGLLILISLVLLLVRVSFILIESLLQKETIPFLTEYTGIMTKVLGLISNTLDGMILISVATLLILVVPELVLRIVHDSLANWIYSIWVSFRLRKFLMRQADHEGEGIFKLQQHNKAIRKSIIDIKEKKITYFVKLPNDVQAQKLLLESKEILREEISSLFPKFTFSNFDRYKHWLRIEGTKIR
ncbi:hypothetical protein [Paenibacillus sp. FSL R5-0908]|uniref:hypothetical protein n=1 Tax=Paenibacillus sp. FSL R5-0908 TaxID=2921664 RepID=UPI0009D68A61